MSAPGDYDDGEISGMIGRGKLSTRRKPAPVPLCPPQTPHAARTRTRPAAVGSQRLTAWATARPLVFKIVNVYWRWRYFSLSLSLYGSGVLLDLGHFFSILILYTVGRTSWTRNKPVVRALPTHRTTQTQNKHTQTTMPWMRFEPTIPVFERAKTVHDLHRAATAMG
jgi:hypothetical protein